MKHFFDTEFIEGFHKPLFGKKRHFIDLISIAIVSEDKRALYLISNEYNYNDANDWVKENVIQPLYIKMVHGDNRNMCSVSNFHKHYGFTNEEIKNKILEFTGCWRDQLFWRAQDNTEMYAYYADYDWVLLCSLFGRMIDLPKGFPMYCIDLKQMLDEHVKSLNQIKYTQFIVNGTDWKATAPLDKKVFDIDKWDNKTKLELIKSHPLFPKQENEHDASDDAKWNMKLYEFLKTL